jgi:hypothetical protein
VAAWLGLRAAAEFGGLRELSVGVLGGRGGAGARRRRGAGCLR